LLKILQNSIPGNLVAAPSLRKSKPPGPTIKKSEDEQRKEDESRWDRLKNLRKAYGSGFLSGKKNKEKEREDKKTRRTRKEAGTWMEFVDQPGPENVGESLYHTEGGGQAE